MVKIAVNTAAGPKNQWNTWHQERGWLDIELDLSRSYRPVEQKSLDNAKADLKIFYMSAHSTADAIFHKIDLLEKAQQYLFLSEIIISSQLGIKELNFHLPKEIDVEMYKPRIVAILQQAVTLAEEYNVQLILENNWKGAFSKSADLLWVVKNFPQIKLCIDIGHAHVAHNASELKFIEELAPYILNCHVHDNNGVKDQHLALGEGNINYKEILDFMLQKTKLNRIIIENSTEEDIKKSISVLNDILKLN